MRILFLLLISSVAFGQTTLDVYKEKGLWKYRRTEVGFVSDTSQIPDSAPVVPPIPPVTPPSNSVTVNPGQSIKLAVERAAAGTLVIISAGTYNEPSINVPVGVNIQGLGAVIINCTTAGQAGQSNRVGSFNLVSSAATPGNQTITNITFEGNNSSYGGLMIEKRDNVKVTGCTVRNFNFTGIWAINLQNLDLSNNDFYNTGWSSSAYLSGAVNIWNISNSVIQGNKFRSDKNNKGTGIEALWKFPDNPNTLSNIKILRNTFRLSHQNPWNNGSSKNFSIELHNTDYRGIEIAYNDFGNEVSLASHRPGNGQKTLIHDNYGNLGGDTYFLETVADDFEVYNNTMENSSMFTANFQPNSKWKNWNFYDNEMKNPAPALAWGACAVMIGQSGVQNVVIRNNKFPTDRKVIQYQGVQGGVTLIDPNQ